MRRWTDTHVLIKYFTGLKDEPRKMYKDLGSWKFNKSSKDPFPHVTSCPPRDNCIESRVALPKPKKVFLGNLDVSAWNRPPKWGRFSDLISSPAGHLQEAKRGGKAWQDRCASNDQLAGRTENGGYLCKGSLFISTSKFKLASMWQFVSWSDWWC